KEEAVAEMVALAWKWFGRLHARGKEVGQFPAAFVSLVARAVNQGRRLTGQESVQEVLNPRCQQRHGFRVMPLPSNRRGSFPRLDAEPQGQRMQEALEERLRDNTQTPVPEQAAFRIDWPAWQQTRTERDRRIIADLTAGERTVEVSRKYGISPGRVSQLRQEFHAAWLRFHGESANAPAAGVAGSDVSQPTFSLESLPRRTKPMSHLVTIQTKVHDPAAVRAACLRLGLPAPVQGTAALFSGEASGLLVQLPGWEYPAVIDTLTGVVRYDHYNGAWGDPVHLDRFLQRYAV